MEKYTVQANDSLIGISLKFNISLYSLLRMNSLSEDSLVFPGMQIKIKPGSEEKKKDYLLQANINYCCVEGTIPGKLTIFPLFLRFEPSSIPASFKFSDSDERFELIINIKDVFEAQLLENACIRSREPIYFIQLLLFTTGHEAIAELPIARIYFKVKSIQVHSNISDIHKRNEAIKESSMEIVNKINELKAITQQPSDFLTKIPVPDYLSTYLSSSQDPQIEEVQSFIQINDLSIDSSILTPYEFHQIEKFLPDIQKFSSTKLLYSSEKNGFSLRTLYNQCCNKGPCIFIVKDSQNLAFGAYLSPFLQVSNDFYGDGSTFLFTFKEKKGIKCFLNKGQAYKFYCTNFEGIIIGYG